MKGERLGNFLRCVEEHLPLHWKTWKVRWWQAKISEVYVQANLLVLIIFMFSLLWRTMCMLMAYIFWPRDSDVVFFVSKDRVFSPAVVHLFFFHSAGCHKEEREAKSDRRRYSVIIIFTANFNSENWVLLSNITAKLLQRQTRLLYMARTLCWPKQYNLSLSFLLLLLS